ncbi:hypothetical protein RI129_003064 [Pyrocoelia pectoralis]|uniref:Uncharacterized protein n=1 Tax=Pyrocoelia pectoralis TaxID=417401 RepID=A0AAN7ZMR0_9COLE
MKRKKNIIRHNKRTGESPQADPYEEELSRIAAIDDSIEPAVKIGVGKCVVINKLNSTEPIAIPSTSSSPSGSPTVTPSGTLKKKRLADVMLEISKNKEEGRERRHKEKLELLRVMSEKLFGSET